MLASEGICRSPCEMSSMLGLACRAICSSQPMQAKQDDHKQRPAGAHVKKCSRNGSEVLASDDQQFTMCNELVAR